MRVRLVPVGTVDRVAGLACLGAWAAALVILGHHFFEITNYRVLTDIGDAPEVFRKRPHLVAVAAVLALMGIAALWGSQCSWTRVAWPAGLASLSLVRYMVTGRVGLADAIGFVLYSGVTAARLLAARPHSVRPAAPSAPIPLALLGLLALANTLYFYHIQQNYFEAFQLGYGDIGSYCRRVHNTAVGLGFLRENPGAPAFYDHFNPALALLVPVYWLFPDIRCLMLVQSVCLSLLAVQLYHTIRPRGGHALALLWAAIACLYPPLTQLHYSYSYGFHPITLALPLVLASYGFASQGRWRAFTVCVAVAFLVEEQVAALYVGVALWLAFVQKRRKAGLVVALASILYFILVANVLMPHWADSRFMQYDKFTHLGNNTVEILLSPVLRPAEFWGRIFDLATLRFLLLLTAPLLLLPLAELPLLLTISIPLLFVLVWRDPHCKTITFHYQSILLPALLLAAAQAALQPRPWVVRTAFLGMPAPAEALAPRWLTFGAVASVLLGCYFFGLHCFSNMTVPFPRRPTEAQQHIRRQLRAAVPHDGSLAASERLAAHFWDARTLTVGEVGQADVVVIDRHDRWGWNTPAMLADMQRRVQQGEYRQVAQWGAVCLFRRQPR